MCEIPILLRWTLNTLKNERVQVEGDTIRFFFFVKMRWLHSKRTKIYGFICWSATRRLFRTPKYFYLPFSSEVWIILKNGPVKITYRFRFASFRIKYISICSSFFNIVFPLHSPSLVLYTEFGIVSASKLCTVFLPIVTSWFTAHSRKVFIDESKKAYKIMCEWYFCYCTTFCKV